MVTFYFDPVILNCVKFRTAAQYAVIAIKGKRNCIKSISAMIRMQFKCNRRGTSYGSYMQGAQWSRNIVHQKCWLLAKSAWVIWEKSNSPFDVARIVLLLLLVVCISYNTPVLVSNTTLHECAPKWCYWVHKSSCIVTHDTLFFSLVSIWVCILINHTIHKFPSGLSWTNREWEGDERKPNCDKQYQYRPN